MYIYIHIYYIYICVCVYVYIKYIYIYLYFCIKILINTNCLRIDDPFLLKKKKIHRVSYQIYQIYKAKLKHELTPSQKKSFF